MNIGAVANYGVLALTAAAMLNASAAPSADPSEETAFAGFRECIRRSEYRDSGPDRCITRLREYIATHQAAAGLPLRAAKLVRREWNSARAVPLFRSAVAQTRVACADEELALSVVAGLGLSRDDAEEIVAGSRALAFETCWNELKGPIMNAFASDAGHTRANSCDVLMTRNVLSDLQSERCLALAKR